MESLDLKTAKEFLARTLKSTVRGAGNVGAFVLAIPVGTFTWLEYDPEARVEFIRNNITDQELRKWLVSSWLEEARKKPSWWNEVKFFYDNIKPRPSRPYLHQYTI